MKHEAAKRDIRWRGFEVRVAQKELRLGYQGWLSNIKGSRCAWMVSRYLQKRSSTLISNCTAGSVSGLATKSVKREVRKVDRIHGIASMEKKPVLRKY